MLAAAYLYPTSIWLFVVVLLVSFAILSFVVFGKHREAYLQDTFSRAVLVRNTSIEMISILLILLLAGCLGWYIVKVVADYMDQSFATLIIAITISLIAGAMVGLLINRLTKHLIKTSPAN
jgi:uncharacterized membrane protein